MRRPSSITPFITAKQWASLRLFEVEPDGQAEVVGVLVAAFDGEKRGKVPQGEITSVLKTARDIANGFRVKLDSGGFNRKILREAEALVAKQKQNKRRKP